MLALGPSQLQGPKSPCLQRPFMLLSGKAPAPRGPALPEPALLGSTEMCGGTSASGGPKCKCETCEGLHPSSAVSPVAPHT